MFQKKVTKRTRLKSQVVLPRGLVLAFFGLFIVANLLRRLFQFEADLASNSCGLNLEMFEDLIANSLLFCVTLMCF